MDNLSIELIALLIISICLWGIKIIPGTVDCSQPAIHQEAATSLRGILALFIIIHHLTFGLPEAYLFSQIGRFTRSYVAMFFFLSGYGLQKSFLKHKDYKNSFLIYRFPKLLFPYLLANFIYWLMYLAFDCRFTIKEIILSILHGNPIVSNSWFLLALLIYYLVFYLIMLLFGSNPRKMIVAACLYYLIWIMLFKSSDILWYGEVHLLVIGMIWATYEKKLLPLLCRKYWCTLLFLGVVFLAGYLFKNRLFSALPLVKREFIFLFIFTHIFVLLVITAIQKIKLGNTLLNFLGDISFEIYLYHGIFIQSLRNDIVYMQSDVLWCLCVFVGTIILAYFTHILCKNFLYIYNKAINFGF